MEKYYQFYSREVTKRVPINKFGKLGFKNYQEMVMTDDISKFNHRKRIKFTKASEDDVKEFIKLNKLWIADVVEERLI